MGKLARAHRRVRNLRRDCLHKVTTHLAKSHGQVVIEDLNVRGMMGSVRGTDHGTRARRSSSSPPGWCGD